MYDAGDVSQALLRHGARTRRSYSSRNLSGRRRRHHRSTIARLARMESGSEPVATLSPKNSVVDSTGPTRIAAPNVLKRHRRAPSTTATTVGLGTTIYPISSRRCTRAKSGRRPLRSPAPSLGYARDVADMRLCFRRSNPVEKLCADCTSRTMNRNGLSFAERIDLVLHGQTLSALP